MNIMVKLYDKGIYLLNGTEIVEDSVDAQAAIASKTGTACSKAQAAANTGLQYFESTQYVRKHGAASHQIRQADFS